jgi:hypothetical protein
MSDLNAPTPERARRSAFVSAPAIGTEAEAARAGARMYRALSSLDRLLRDGSIERRQAEAGERLRDDYELGVAGARNSAGSGAAPGWYYAEARLAAVRRYKQAEARLGPLWDYTASLALGSTISELARQMKRNRQEIAGICKLGLDVLADVYGIKREA